MSSFSNLKMVNKLGILVGVPLIGVLVFSWMLFTAKYAVYKEMRLFENLTSLSVKIGALVHETQKERGRTAGFIGGGGKKFITELPAQRPVAESDWP